MGKVAERRLNLREALIRAAEERIGRKGLSALRARDLAEEVGCALGAIYNVFADLDDLVLAVNARTLAAFEQVVAGEGTDNRGDPVDPEAAVVRLVELALAYLSFAETYGHRWRALFEHRMAGGGDIPSWYRDAQRPLFSLVEAPLRALRPDLDDTARAILGRSLFSAVHGMVSLGLEQKLGELPHAVLGQQVEEVVTAMGEGLPSESRSGSQRRSAQKARRDSRDRGREVPRP